MSEFDVIAEPRSETGKGAARRLRRAGSVPGVVYGAGQDVALIKMPRHALEKQLNNEAFFSHILRVRVGGEETQAVVKALQRDPASNFVTHLDFQRVSSTQELHIRVPLHYMNEEDCPGKKAGGVVNHLLVDVEITCLPKNLPEFIEVDLSGLELGDSLHLSDLKLPEGVTFATALDSEHDQAIVNIQHPQKIEEEEDEAGEAADESGDAAPEDDGAAKEGDA